MRNPNHWYVDQVAARYEKRTGFPMPLWFRRELQVFCWVCDFVTVLLVAAVIVLVFYG